MRPSVIYRFILWIAFLAAFTVLLAADEDSGLRVTGIQFDISPEIYTSQEAFREAADRALRQAVQPSQQRDQAELVVFPEYTGVFFVFFDAPGELESISSLEEGGAFLQKNYNASNLHEFFLTEQRRAGEAMDAVWGNLARHYGVYLLGGSYFSADPASSTGFVSGKLYNRAVLYSPEGQRIYQQDKVYLTPFETDLLQVSPGEITDARPFIIGGRSIALSICRDTFFSAWEEQYRDADLWIDIKANGEVFTPEQAEIFRGALPERLKQLPGVLGMTVCLNGEFLDLLWEGPSSVISVEPGPGGKTIHWIDRAGTVRGQDLVSVRFPVP